MNRMRYCLEQGVCFEFQVMFDSLDIPVTDPAESHAESLAVRPTFALASRAHESCIQELPHRCPVAAKIKAAFVSPVLRFEHFSRGIRPLSLRFVCFHLFPI
jgi:hypothetical protein